MNRRRSVVVTSVACLLFAGGLGAADVGSLIQKLQDPSGDVRRQAWENAAEYGAGALPALARLAAGENREAALAALRAMARIAHASAAPGSDKRTETARMLAALLEKKDLPAPLKLAVLDWLGSVGGDEVVPAVAQALAAEETRDAARRALERIPGEGASKALAEALAGAEGDDFEGLVGALGRKRTAAALAALTRLASEEGDSSRRVAAARALTRIGESESIPVIGAAIRAAPEKARPALVDDYLKMADDLKAAGKLEAAERIERGVLERARDARLRYAALYALCREKPAEKLGVILAALNDESPRVRDLAAELVSAAKGEGTDKALLDEYGRAEGARKAVLLGILAGRQVAGIDKLVAQAVGDPSIDVRVTALSRSGKLGDPAIEPLLLEAAKEGSPQVKEVALRSYLDLAVKCLESDAKKAQGMYARAYELATAADLKGRALIGLARTGADDAFARIEAARKDPELAADAGRATVAYARVLGKSARKEKAVEMLMELVSSGAARETAHEAVKALEELGADPTVFQKKQGLVTSWWIIGPFPNEGGKGFDTAYSPEAEVRLDGTQKDHRGRDRKWVEHRSTRADGVIDFEQLFQRTQNVCAYAYCELEVARAQDVLFKLGSDDGVVCWLNGEKLHATNATRALTMDQDSVKAKLKEGKNKILLKVTQGGGEWEFVLRLTTPEGRALDLTRLAGSKP